MTGSSGPAVTLETDSYDAFSLTDCPNITAHDSAYYQYSGLLRGNRTTTIQPGSTRNVHYDIGGMPVSADDGHGHSVTITPAAGTNFAAPGTILPNGNSTYTSTYTYTPALQPAQATDPNGKTTTNAYDSYGRLLTSTTVTNMVTTYTYDYSQHTVSASAHSGWTVGTPDHLQRTTTDGFGRTIRTEAGEISGTILSVVDTRYAPCACSPLGKMSAVSQPYAPGATPVWTTYAYDASGRTLTVTAPDGVSITSYAYQGNQTTITDPAGKSKTYTYDASGNLLQVTEPGSLATFYTYDVLNHLTQVSMTRGGTTQTRTFTYDSSTQRLTQATTPEAGTVQYSYNDDGTLQSKTDAMGQQTQYTYDALARVTQASYLPNGQNEDACQRVSYYYDAYRGQGSSPIGRLTGMYWSGGPSCIYGFQEEYTYDAQGRVWERIFTMTNAGSPGVTPITLASYFQYDAEGRLTVSQYPAGTSGSPNTTVTYTTEHDALGRPSDLYMGTPQQPTWLVSGATYNAAGQLTAMSTNAYAETLQYNANLQLTRLAAGGGGIDFTYTYPASGNNGRISQMTDNIAPGEQVNYTYDVLNRLVQAGSTMFAYDGFGNLTQQGQTTLSIDPTTNRINSANYTYNANGNVTQTPGQSTPYSYDVANRLVSNGAIYTPRNQRVFDGTYLYLYTPEGKLAGKYAPAWGAYTSSKAFIQGGQPNVYFGGKLIQEQGQWVMTDRLGSVRLKASGERSSYQPYGAEVAPTSDQRTKFATYYRDSAGLDYAGQRYYSPGTGGFMTPDPSMDGVDHEDPGTWNAYAYANGDPINFNDPSGLGPVTLPPVVPGFNCSTAFINYAAQFGMTIQGLFDSDQGILGVMSYFEEEGSGSSADERVWAALDWTFVNRWDLSAKDKAWFYGRNNTPTSFAASVTTGNARSQVFTSSGQLQSGFTAQLMNILTGSLDSSQCAGLVDAFDTAMETILAHNNTPIPGLGWIPDPVPGALSFGSNGAVPSHSVYVIQTPLTTIRDGTDVWTFFTDSYRPPKPIRRLPPRRGRGPRPL